MGKSVIVKTWKQSKCPSESISPYDGTQCSSETKWFTAAAKMIFSGARRWQKKISCRRILSYSIKSRNTQTESSA